MKWLSASALDDFLDTTSFGVVEFKPAIADGLMKTLTAFSLEETNVTPSAVDFVAKRGATPDALVKIQTRLANGYAFLLRKDAPALIGKAGSIEGVFVTAASLRERAGIQGAYAIARPLIPTEASAPKPSRDQTLLVGGALLVGVVGLFALALKGAARAAV